MVDTPGLDSNVTDLTINRFISIMDFLSRKSGPISIFAIVVDATKDDWDCGVENIVILLQRAIGEKWWNHVVFIVSKWAQSGLGGSKAKTAYIKRIQAFVWNRYQVTLPVPTILDTFQQDDFFWSQQNIIQSHALWSPRFDTKKTNALKDIGKDIYCMNPFFASLSVVELVMLALGILTGFMVMIGIGYFSVLGCCSASKGKCTNRLSKVIFKNQGRVTYAISDSEFVNMHI